MPGTDASGRRKPEAEEPGDDDDEQILKKRHLTFDYRDAEKLNLPPDDMEMLKNAISFLEKIREMI